MQRRQLHGLVRWRFVFCKRSRDTEAETYIFEHEYCECYRERIACTIAKTVVNRLIVFQLLEMCELYSLFLDSHFC